jgi:uncharacterized membrane protein YGL010W
MKPIMQDIFRRQLARYAEYHRDPRNGAAHLIGIPLLFVAVLVPLALWRVPIGGIQFSIGSLLLVPAVTLWLALDAGVGLAMLIAIVPLAIAAEWIARVTGSVGAWSVPLLLLAAGVASLFVGHAVFERRKPALADDITQMFIGPMFVTAQVLVALGLRRDLAPLLEGKPAGPLAQDRP